MKYIITLSLMIFAANFAMSQYSSNNSYEYQITFEKGEFDNEDVKKIVSEFRQHIFKANGKKSDFTTRFDESGTIYFKSAFPVEECCVGKFFEDRNKSYLSFSEIVKKPDLYAFGK